MKLAEIISTLLLALLVGALVIGISGAVNELLVEIADQSTAPSSTQESQ